MENEKKYYAFISYKREDEEWAKWLQYKLEHYKLPSNLNGRTDLPKEIRPVFRDQSELAAGVLADEINKALTNSKYLIVICSPRAAQSVWVGKEVQTFIDLGRTDKIIPFIIGGTAHAQNLTDECFPLALLNFPPEQELLGINIDEMGRDAAAVKVVAQMFGLKFDTLWQRYERENRRRRVFIIVAALLLAMIGIGVAVGFSRQNKRIMDQKEKIEKQNEEIQGKNDRLLNDSIIMAAQLDSINSRDELILRQGDSIKASNILLENSNIKLISERDNLKKANWSILANESRFLSEKIITLNEDNSYLARQLAIRILPTDLQNPDRPYTPEAEKALRTCCSSFSAVFNHDDCVNSISFSPNGKRIVSASKDGVVKIWDVESGTLIDTLYHSKEVTSVQYSPMEGKYIVTASYDGIIRVFNAENGKIIHELKGHELCVKHASFSFDGKKIVSASCDNTIKIWDVQTGNLIRTIVGHSNTVNSAVFNKSDTRIVSASSDNTIKMWDSNNGDLLWTFEGHKDNVNYAEFSPDYYGNYIVSASEDGTAKVWDVNSRKEIINFSDHLLAVTSVSFSPDGKQIVSASRDCTIRIWNASNGKEIMYFLQERGWLNTVIYSPNGQLIASCSDDKTIKISNVINNDVVNELGEPNNYWYGKKFYNPIFSPNGRLIISSKPESSDIYIWNVGSSVPQIIKGCRGQVYSVSCSKDSKCIVSSSADNIIRIWDVVSGKMLDSIIGYSDVESVSFCSNPNFDRILIQTSNSVAVYDNKAKKEVNSNSPKGLFYSISSSDICSDGKRVVFAVNEIPWPITKTVEGIIVLWDVERDMIIDTIRGHKGLVNSVKFSLDGKRIVSSSDDKTVKLWDSETRKMMYVLEGHTGEVRYASFSLDNEGKWIVSASQDNTIRIWDSKRGREIHSLKSESKYKYHCEPSFSYVAFNKSGNLIISASSCIKIWTFPHLQDLIDQTHERFKDRPLTQEERHQYYLE